MIILFPSQGDLSAIVLQRLTSLAVIHGKPTGQYLNGQRRRSDGRPGRLGA
jgi:hypothetical protein